MKKYNCRFKKSSGGFSLVEILVAIAIFAMLAYSTYDITQNITQGSIDNSRIAGFFHQQRSLVEMMGNDIKYAFLPLNEADMHQTGVGWRQVDIRKVQQDGFFFAQGTPPSLFYPLLGDQLNRQDDEMSSAPRRIDASKFYTGRETPLGSPIPRLQGTRHHLSFISKNHLRTREGERASRFIKVEYDYRERDQAVFRRESTNAFDQDESLDDEEGWEILESISRFEFRYFDWANQNWADQWDSNSSLTLDRYPTLVEITFTVTDEDLPPSDFQMIFPVMVSQWMMPTQKRILFELSRRIETP